MGYNLHQWDFLKRCLDHYLDGIDGKWMLELGNQRIKKSVLQRDKIVGNKAKIYFEKMGFHHVSFDLNENDGSVFVDLSKDIVGTEFINKFDVITNSGTTEHVEPYQNQYECFRNIHVCAKMGGIFIHIVPEQGGFKDHCQNYYTLEFFENLSTDNNYDILDLDRFKKVNGTLIMACLRKNEDSVFCKDREKVLRYISRKTYSKKALDRLKKRKSYRYITMKKRE